MNLISPSSTYLPLFVTSGTDIKRPIQSLPGHFIFSPDLLVKEAKAAQKLGIGGVILYGVTGKKDDTGSAAFGLKSPVQTALLKLKNRVPELTLVADLCLCQYTSHGHCGIIKKGQIAPRETQERLLALAMELADAGADCVMPSGMQDGLVTGLRGLFTETKYTRIKIFTQASKFCSSFYVPFRAAAKVTLRETSGVTKATYQLDPADPREALRCLTAAENEGADSVWVKPALPYLDIVTRAAKIIEKPLGVFQTSGEFGMIKAGALKRIFSEDAMVKELFYACGRAGASYVSSYHATTYAKLY